MCVEGKLGFLESGIVMKESLESHNANETPDINEIIAAGEKDIAKVVDLVEG